jgi:hypothetical protein
MWNLYLKVEEFKENLIKAKKLGEICEDIAGELELMLYDIASPFTLSGERKHIRDTWSN